MLAPAGNTFKTSWQSYKTSGGFLNFKSLNPSAAGRLENEMETLFKEAEKAENASVVNEAAEVASVTEGKLWTKIDEHGGDFHGAQATYYDVNVTYQTSREQVGVAFLKNNILEFHLNIPEKLQGQGIGSKVFKEAINDYAPSKVKGWWKVSDIYTGNESINLSIFKQKLKEGLSPEKAAFETPTGKILKANNFDGAVEIIKNTSDEVIIYFNPKL